VVTRLQVPPNAPPKCTLISITILEDVKRLWCLPHLQRLPLSLSVCDCTLAFSLFVVRVSKTMASPWLW
jgi:hypothetical protein